MEKKRIFDAALKIVKDTDKEQSKTDLQSRLELEQTSKVCTNCSNAFEKRLRKCPNCKTPFQACLQSNEQNDENKKSPTWNTSIYHEHVIDQHPHNIHSVRILDPILTNPNKKYDIFAITQYLQEKAGIESFGEENLVQRKWCYVVAML